MNIFAVGQNSFGGGKRSESEREADKTDVVFTTDVRWEEGTSTAAEPVRKFTFVMPT